MAIRALASPSHPAPATSTTAVGPAGLGLWTFLWGAGCRRLHVSPTGTPGPSDLVVSSLSELLSAVEDERTRATALSNLAIQLQTGFLERWLSFGLEHAAARSASTIRDDARGRKLERWLQSAGLASYFVGLHRVDSVHDLATLPERGGDLTVLWDHIREGVPQARFKSEPRVVETLDAVRNASMLPAHARPLIACLRLGLRRLPYANRFLETLGDLEHALLEPGGRDALCGLLTSGVLENWVETIAPGHGAQVAAARGLDPAIAVDRVIRGLVGPAVYPAPGVKANDFTELIERAGGLFHTLCGDPGSRARIRDALWGPIRLPGTPPAVLDTPEAELASFHPEYQAHRFAWLALQLPILHLGARVVHSLAEYLAVIGSPEGRADAVTLAAFGVISAWYRLALGCALPEPLSVRVSEATFPALCIEMGEPPPRVELVWPRTSATIPDDGAATFEATAINHDPVRTAVLALSATTRPPRGSVDIDSHLMIAPGAAVAARLTYRNALGVSGSMQIAVTASHAGPKQVPVATQELSVVAGFPWLVLLPTIVGWIAGVSSAVLTLRLALQPVIGSRLYDAAGALRGVSLGGSAIGLGLLVAIVGFVVMQVLRAIRHKQLWLPKRSPAAIQATRYVTIAGSLIALYIHAQRDLHDGMLLYALLMAPLVIKLAERDVRGAAMFGVWMIVGRELGMALLWAIGGFDTIAILASRVISSSDHALSLAIAGWWLCGAVLGLAFGAAVALRGVGRPIHAELTRVATIGIAAFVIAILGPTSVHVPPHPAPSSATPAGAGQ